LWITFVYIGCPVGGGELSNFLVLIFITALMCSEQAMIMMMTAWNQGSLNCLDPGPCNSKWNMQVLEREEAFHQGPTPIAVSVAIGSQRPWRQLGQGWTLHILDALL
jgi:hypothetical protein